MQRAEQRVERLQLVGEPPRLLARACPSRAVSIIAMRGPSAWLRKLAASLPRPAGWPGRAPSPCASVARVHRLGPQRMELRVVLVEVADAVRADRRWLRQARRARRTSTGAAPRSAIGTVGGEGDRRSRASRAAPRPAGSASRP